jgi:hypothetical protein
MDEPKLIAGNGFLLKLNEPSSMMWIGVPVAPRPSNSGRRIVFASVHSGYVSVMHEDNPIQLTVSVNVSGKATG